MNLRNKLAFFIALNSYVELITRGTSPLSLQKAIANSLQYVKAFGGTEQRNLPDGYTALEYIESSGTQYIDIDVSGDATFIGTAQSTTDSPTTSQVLVANSGASAGHWFGVQSPGAGSSFAKRWGLGATATASSTIDGTTKVDLEITFTQTSQYGTVNDQTLTRESSSITHTDWIIFAGNTTPSYGFIGKVWGLKVVQNDVLVRNLIPAKNSSNVIGMYDLVSGQFFTNQGTGDFVADPTATPTPDAPINIVSNNGAIKVRHQSGLPLGYTLLDYIKSTANIPLGFYTNQNSEIEAKWYKDGAGAQYAYQANSGSALTNNTTAYATDGGGNWRFGNQTISIAVPLNTNIISIQNKNGVWFNNEQQGVYTDVNDFTGDVEFKALGTPSTGYNPMIRISYIKHRQNGVLLGHYVPCVAPDNSIGLYDLIGGVFYTNAAATITAGSTVSDPVEIYTDGTVETINVHGKNLFDKTTYIAGKYYNSSGNIIENPDYGMTGFIPMKSGQTFALSGRTPSGIALFNTSQVWQQQVTGQSFTAPYDGCFVVSVAAGQQDTLQVERGSTATAYEPYYNGGTATAEMLLKVGTYQDVQSIIDGTITRNVGVKVLDGTEDWTYSNSRFRLKISDYLVGSSIMATIISHYKLPAINTGSIANGEARFGKPTSTDTVSSDNTLIVHDDNYTDLNGYKAWLAAQYAAGTPVIIVYPLATPTTESVAGQTLQVQAGDNILEITQASLSGLELEAKYKKRK